MAIRDSDSGPHSAVVVRLFPLSDAVKEIADKPPLWDYPKLESGQGEYFLGQRGRAEEKLESLIARKYSRGASKDVKREMHKFKRGKLRSGKGGRGGKVRSCKQAIAIGLSEARIEGKKVPKRRKI